MRDAVQWSFSQRSLKEPIFKQFRGCQLSANALNLQRTGAESCIVVQNELF